MKKVLVSVSVSVVDQKITLESPRLFQHVNYNFDIDGIKGKAVFEYVGWLDDETNQFNFDVELMDLETLSFRGKDIEMEYDLDSWKEFKNSYKTLFGKDIYEVIQDEFKKEVDEKQITELIERKLLWE